MIEELKLEDFAVGTPIDPNKKQKAGIWDKSFNKKKLAKTQKVAVLYLTNNGQALPFELEPKNGFFTIRGKAYHEREDCTYILGKQRIPLAIIPESDLIPIGKVSWYEKNIKEKFLELQTHTMKGIRHAELVRFAGEKDGVKLNAKAIILLGIAGIVALAIWQGGLI